MQDLILSTRALLAAIAFLKAFAAFLVLFAMLNNGQERAVVLPFHDLALVMKFTLHVTKLAIRVPAGNTSKTVMYLQIGAINPTFVSPMPLLRETCLHDNLTSQYLDYF